MSKNKLLTIDDVNRLSCEDFIVKFGNVVEHCPLFAAALYGERPFGTFEDFTKAISKFMDDLPLKGKEGVLRLHPDLAGHLSLSGQLTTESNKEQSAAGLHNMADGERNKMASLNTQYKEKFGFPFVICARLNKKDAILKGLELRLANTKFEETIAGTNEVTKIACLRLKDIVDDNSNDCFTGFDFLRQDMQNKDIDSKKLKK